MPQVNCCLVARSNPEKCQAFYFRVISLRFPDHLCGHQRTAPQSIGVTPRSLERRLHLLRHVSPMALPCTLGPSKGAFISSVRYGAATKFGLQPHAALRSSPSRTPSRWLPSRRIRAVGDTKHPLTSVCCERNSNRCAHTHQLPMTTPCNHQTPRTDMTLFYVRGATLV